MVKTGGNIRVQPRPLKIMPLSYAQIGALKEMHAAAAAAEDWECASAIAAELARRKAPGELLPNSEKPQG